MATVDFTAWVEPDLILELGGHTYRVCPPTVEEAKVIVALTVRTEIQLGLVAGPLSPDLSSLLESLEGTPLADITLRPETHAEMVKNGVSQTTISRVAWYAMIYWSRGKDRADKLAQLMWSPRPEEPSGSDASGEA